MTASRSDQTDFQENLMTEVKYRSIEKVRALLQDPRYQAKQLVRNRTLIIQAIYSGSNWQDETTQVVDLLITHGEDPNQPCFDVYDLETYPLHAAITNGIWPTVELLIARLADVNQIDGRGQSPLTAMLKSGSPNERIIKILKAKGANPNHTENDRSAADMITSGYLLEKGYLTDKEVLAWLPKKKFNWFPWFKNNREISSQDNFIKLGRLLGYYKNTIQGVCHGVSVVARQAILTGDTDQLINRLLRIKRSTPEKIMQDMTAASQKRLIIYTDLKNKPDEWFQSEFNKLPEEQKITASKLSFSRLKQYLIDKKIDQQLTDREKLDVEMPAFYDMVMAHQRPAVFYRLYPWQEIYNALFRPYVFRERILSLASSKKYEDLYREPGANPAEFVGSTYGIYSDDELVAYFTSLKDAFDNASSALTDPIVMQVGNVHEFTLSYNTSKKSWMMIEVNSIESFQGEKMLAITSIAEMAVYVRNAIHAAKPGIDEKEGLFSAMAVYFATHPAAHDKLNQCLAAWMKTASYQKLHAITPERAFRVDTHDRRFTWQNYAKLTSYHWERDVTPYIQELAAIRKNHTKTSNALLNLFLLVSATVAIAATALYTQDSIRRSTTFKLISFSAASFFSGMLALMYSMVKTRLSEQASPKEKVKVNTNSSYHKIWHVVPPTKDQLVPVEQLPPTKIERASISSELENHPSSPDKRFSFIRG